MTPFSTTAPISKRLWGTYAEAPGADGSPWELTSLHQLEAKLGYRFPVVSGFVPYNEVPLANLKTLAGEGRTIELSYDVEVPFAAILSGKYDATFKRIATQLAGLKTPVYLRLWAEMNGDWASWSVGADSSHVTSTAQWIAAWKHVVTIFRAAAPNVRFIWCPNVTDEGRTRLERYWPGAEWVDALGFDGYNWGKGDWQSGGQIFAPIYRRLTALDPNLPIWVGELGSAEGSAGQKPAWVAALMQESGYPRLQALCWFSVKKERDWRMDSSSASLAAFRKGLVG